MPGDQKSTPSEPSRFTSAGSHLSRRPLRGTTPWGDMWPPQEVIMALPLLLALLQAVHPTTPAAPAAPAQTPVGSVAAWTLHFNGDIRWQQITPAGALLISTDGALAGVDVERGLIVWQKPELGGLPVDSVRMVEGSLLMEAARPGLSVIFDPVTGTELFDSRRLGLTRVVTRRVLPQTGTLIVHGRRASGPPVVALYDLKTGNQRWVSDSLFQQSGPKKGGLGGLMQGLVRVASEGTQLEVLQAGPDVIVVNTLTSLRGLDARTGATRWSATLPTARAGNPAKHVRLFPSIDKPDRIYVGFDDRLMAYRLADGQPLWAKPAIIQGWVHGIVQHPAGIIILPESPPPDEATGNVRIINGVVQTGLNIARYADGTTLAEKPLRMRGTVTDAIITGGSAVLAVDAESRTFVNVLDVATATVRLQKDVKIKGQLDYAELTPGGLLYISRSDPATNGEVNVIDLARGEQKFKGGEDPTTIELRQAGIVLISPQNIAIVGRDGQIKQQAYHPAPQLPGLLRALYRINSVRAGLYGAAASAYGDAFAQASRNATDTTAKRITGQLAAAYSQGGAQLQGYSSQAGALASKRFKASLATPGYVFVLTK